MSKASADKKKRNKILKEQLPPEGSTKRFRPDLDFSDNVESLEITADVKETSAFDELLHEDLELQNELQELLKARRENGDTSEKSSEVKARVLPFRKRFLEKRAQEKAAALAAAEEADTEKAAPVNKHYVSDYKVEKVGFQHVGTPEELTLKLEQVGYHCLPFLAAQLSLLFNTEHESIRSILLEGPSGCGKTYMAKSLAKVTGAELMCLSCFPGLDVKQLIEYPSTYAMTSAMAGKETKEEDLINLGIISRAFLKSQEKPVILLIDEIDKGDEAIDTFFLGPIQDARIWLESRAPIDANIDNIAIFFTKNMDRKLNDALVRRCQPVQMTYLDTTLEKKVLEPHCWPELINNLSRLADTMRYGDGSYKFERPPAPEELLKAGRYVTQLLEWDIVDYSFIGRNVWYMLSKSETDRFVMELMLRYHPEYYDSLRPNGRSLTIDEVYAKLGRIVVQGIVEDPEDQKRKTAYKVDRAGLRYVGTPAELTEKLAKVKYECMPYLATQISLLLNSEYDRVRSILLEGPPGCGKSYLAKALATITGAEFMCLSCYQGMNTQHLIESPSTLGLANAMTSKKGGNKADLVNLGILSRAFLKSQNQPVILLIDEIDKVDVGIDTFFLGPIQDGTIYLESRPPIDARIDNLLLVFTKNFERSLSDALLRRMHPIHMTYLTGDLERKILRKDCSEQLTENILAVVDRMRNSGGSYGFDRPPAPEELRTFAQYANLLLGWGSTDFAQIGQALWAMISKSEHDRAVLEHMMRFHPDYLDPLYPDGRNLTIEQVYAKFGRIILKDILQDPEELRRQHAWKEMQYNY